MKYFAVIVLVLALLGSAYWLGTKAAKPLPPVIHVDTVIVRDTLVVEIPVPEYHYRTRTDTVRLRVPGDTITVEVEVPIERKVYHTDDFRAVVEGYRPVLIDMQIYRKTEYITRTEYIDRPRKRFGVGVQAGYGYNLDQIKLSPYIGIGVSYNLWQF